MNWNKGFSATYYAYIMDQVTWRETERLQITGGTITHSPDGLRDAADLNVVGYHGDSEKWVRVYLDANQGGSSAHIPLFTGLACAPERNIDGIYETNTLQCYSVLKPAQDVLLERGYYVPADISGTTVIRDLLSVCPAEVIYTEEAPALQYALIAEDGETNLSMVEKVLNAINWRMRLHGDGSIELTSMPIEASIRLDPLDNDIIEPSINITRDWYGCPNVFRAIKDNLTAIARDDNPDSPLSTISRGREIWAEESSVALNTGEGLSEYAVRRLKELQKVSLDADYQRRFIPDLYVGDLINLHYPEQGLDGIFIVQGQTIDIGYGAPTSEEVKGYE